MCRVDLWQVVPPSDSSRAGRSLVSRRRCPWSVLLWELMHDAMFMTSLGPFSSAMYSPGPPGSQGAGPCHVDRTSLRNGPVGGPSLCLPPCGGMLTIRSPCSSTSGSGPPFRGIASTLGSRSALIQVSLRSCFCGGASSGDSHMAMPPRANLSTSHAALTCAQGTSASSLAAVAISALPAGLTPVVPSARAGAAPTTCNAPPHLSVSTQGGSTSPTSTFSGTPASPKGLAFSGKAGDFPGNDGTPSSSCRTSACGLGGFKSSG